MKKNSILFLIFTLSIFQIANAQSKSVTGTVTSLFDGSKIQGVKVVLKGSSEGTYTNADGFYSLHITNDTGTIVYSLIGMQTIEVDYGSSSIVNVAMEKQGLGIDETVITALNISRKKNSLGFAVQKLQGDEINAMKNENFITSLSGKIAGAQIKNTSNLWGSADVIMRGRSLMMGDNQVLYVVDGIVIDNASLNNSEQLIGRHGYDYGNIISDINPNDIESINVLKGAAASVLYGSRGANGVILINTKNGSHELKSGENIGVTLSSNITFGTIDKSTFPKYQKEYGAGFGYYYSGEDDGSEHPGLEYYADVNGDGIVDYTPPYDVDGSRGEKFDPNLLVYQFDAAEPSSPNYLKKTPWIAAENGPETFFQKAVDYTNGIAINGHVDRFDFRLSYNKTNKIGIMPNSSFKRNNLSFNGKFNILDNLKINTQLAYIQSRVKGRNATGNANNILTSFRQFFQVNVDIKTLENLYKQTDRNVTWNMKSFDDPRPSYWDNPYWVRYQNYESDKRTHLIGATSIEYNLTKEFSVMGRFTIDTYSDLQEERNAIGSVALSEYSKYTHDFKETNLSLLMNYSKVFSDKIQLNANLGYDNRQNSLEHFFGSTIGGLVLPNVYNLSNSLNPTTLSTELKTDYTVNGYFGFASLGYNNLLYFDGTYRHDVFPKLYDGKNGDSYYSASASFLFDKFIRSEHVDLGKFRLNYAKLGRVASYFSNLKPERTKSYEAGLEMHFLKSRLGFDVTLYKNNTYNQLFSIQTSGSNSGYPFREINVDEIEYKGIELILSGTPVETRDFKWNININWAKNKNEVIELVGNEVTDLQIASLQGGVSINASVGLPYGTIIGSDFVYHDNGGKLINKTNGSYLRSTNDQVIGNINPDWYSGVRNTIKYKNLSLSFLIDIQKGGDVFSIDLWCGMGAGLYEETTGDNDLGNPMRDPIVWNDASNKTKEGGYASNSGGIIEEGVLSDGSQNWIRRSQEDYKAIGWATDPNARFVYDASYIKLREVVLNYNFPSNILSKTPIKSMSFALVGSNLWIIHKNLPHADPEIFQSKGNIQGLQSGVMPTTRYFGVNLNVQF